MSQFLVSSLISENWITIRNKIKNSKTTEFIPSITNSGGRSVSGVNFDGVARRKVAILCKYGRLIKTDIVRFYPSIYTHSIPWALLGKAWVKANKNTPLFQNGYENMLDRAIQSGQNGQTIGIPIGPDTSRIISELIACEIENIIKKKLPDYDERAVRYVDDMLIGLRETETQDFVLSKISSALYDFELDINGDKTEMHGIGESHSAEWLHFIRTFELSKQPSRHREDIDSFFNHSMQLADAHLRENVISFATRRASSFILEDNNYDHLIRWMIYAANRSASCLSFVVEHTSYMYAEGKNIPIDEIKAFIRGQIPIKASLAHTSELAWLLFWAKEISCQIDAEILVDAWGLRSSVVALLCLDLNQIGLINGSVDDSFWHKFANEDGLKSEMWLVAYEATKRKWWTNTTS